jgi:hypothetical protein
MATSARHNLTNDRSTITNLRLYTRILAISFIMLNTNLLFMLHRSPLPSPLLNTSMLSSPYKLNYDQSHSNPQDETKKSTAGKFAYVFLMAGCDPKQKERYIGYVLNILISKFILKQSGSTADVVVLTRMSSETTEETISEQEMLEKGGVIVRYLPKIAGVDNFYSAMLDKFQVLKYHQEYDRILFLDSDITPFCNLDYMFHNSMGPDAVLAPNAVLSYKHEPAQGGFFLIHPEKGDYEKIQEIIDHRMQRYNFSEEFGWGHKIEPPDYWDSMNDKNQTRWDFYGACKWSNAQFIDVQEQFNFNNMYFFRCRSRPVISFCQVRKV